jgi:hypothetical protein
MMGVRRESRKQKARNNEHGKQCNFHNAFFHECSPDGSNVVHTLKKMPMLVKLTISRPEVNGLLGDRDQRP